MLCIFFFFFFQAEDGIRDLTVTGVQTCALPIFPELLEDFDRSRALVHFPLSESFGLVVAEALARSLKVFAARVGGIVDITERIDSAELFDPGDWEGLQTGIAKWIHSGCPAPSGAAEL